MKHSPEPWFAWVGASGALIYDGTYSDKDEVIAFLDRNDGEKRTALNSERIVACVNFCRQFDTEWLEDRELHRIDTKEQCGTLGDIKGFCGLAAVVKNEPASVG